MHHEKRLPVVKGKIRYSGAYMIWVAWVQFEVDDFILKADVFEAIHRTELYLSSVRQEKIKYKKLVASAWQGSNNVEIASLTVRECFLCII